MVPIQESSREEVLVRRDESDGRVHLVADLGPGAGERPVDVVDGTAIVVGDEQYELSLPEGEASASMNNGVLTVEVQQ